MICAPDDTARGAIHSNLALCYLKLKDYAMATTHADVAMCLRPGWEKGYFRHGETAFEQRDYATALKDYEEAVKCAPNDAALKHRVKLAKEASNGFYFRQLLPGRDIAVNAKNPIEQQIFGAATQMQNFIYLVGDARTRECVAIDACWDVDGILAVAKNDKMRITKAVATHYHFDHVGGKPPPPFDALGIEVPGIKQLEAAGLPVHVQEEDAKKLVEIGVPEKSMTTHKDGDVLEIGNVRIRFVHSDNPGAPGGGAGIVVSGDTIFPGSCGRLDLPDADKDRMFHSLAKCAASLRDDMIVYPGHNYNGASSTIAKEKKDGLLKPFTKTQWEAMHGK
jgi:glyoxylase-like metal-dependent hydrolase (beta-lactamase superfamily II)